MQSILTELWNGNIAPMERYGQNDREINNLTKLIEKNESNLITTLNDDQKITFEKYTDCLDEYSSLMTQHAFCQGFRLGCRFLTEALAKDI